MKYVLYLLYSLSITTSVQAQIYKFRAVEYAITRDGGKEIKPLHIKCDSFPVVLDTDSDTLSIKSPQGEFYKLKNDPAGYKETDSAVTVRYNAIDKNGGDCYVVVVLSKLESAKHDGFIIIANLNKSFLYYVDR